MFEAISDALANLCDCGHFDSEHYIKDGKLRRQDSCTECECPSFKKAYELKVLD